MWFVFFCSLGALKSILGHVKLFGDYLIILGHYVLEHLRQLWVIFRHFRLVTTIARRKRSTKSSVFLLCDSKHSLCISACNMRTVLVFHSIQLKIEVAGTGLESWPQTDTKPGYHWYYQPHTRPKCELHDFSRTLGMCSEKLACRGMRSFDVDFVIAC